MGFPVVHPPGLCRKACTLRGVFSFPERSIGAKLKFTKPFPTYEQQADRLLQLGLTGDRSKIIERLQSVSYYRLSGYCYPDRKPDPASPKQKLSEFFPDASIDEVWDRYVFDRRLRLLVMDSIDCWCKSAPLR